MGGHVYLFQLLNYIMDLINIGTGQSTLKLSFKFNLGAHQSIITSMLHEFNSTVQNFWKMAHHTRVTTWYKIQIWL